ncbi:hypothetical protein pipiens_011038 [Culex pipiens pipiens]|uniref:Uncharacterized protein n=1 Tax=Culex pipiens pipiens TaxID=38569 RepID=A0ABD1D7V1_CULPP
MAANLDQFADLELSKEDREQIFDPPLDAPKTQNGARGKIPRGARSQPPARTTTWYGKSALGGGRRKTKNVHSRPERTV